MKKPSILGVVHPSAAIEVSYRRKLERMVTRMQADIARQLRAQYETRPPEMAEDASPAADLAALMRRLRRKWQGDFDALAPEMARYFAATQGHTNDRALKVIMRKHGFTVKFTMTAQQQDILSATVAENVSLIKSIASQHLDQVEGLVMRSVTAGRDVGGLNAALQERYAITKKRAALIARDQNNKATAALQASRQAQLGLTSIWLHSAGGKTKRPSHVANSGKPYDPKTGWYDPDAKEWIWPGTLIGCRCVSGVGLPKFIEGEKAA